MPASWFNHAEQILIWFHRYCPVILTTLSIPYGLVVRSRSLLYEYGWFTQHRLPCPVVSVGNLTVGGTGKTPVVIWLANRLQAEGKYIGILSRGYRRATTADCVLVSDGEKVLASPQEVGDEPYLMAQQCPGVVIAVGTNRYQLGLWVLQHKHIDCFILDDGYQHLPLYRDCNLLLVDALDQQGIRALLPAGRLREPLSAANRASAILITRADQAADPPKVLRTLEEAMGNTIASIPIHFSVNRVIHLQTRKTQPREWVAGKQVIIFSGIGNARSFRRMVATLGVTIVQEFEFSDHFEYCDSHLDDIRVAVQQSKAEIVLTTEKDGVKITPFLNETDDIWALKLETTIPEGEEQLLQALPCLSF